MSPGAVILRIIILVVVFFVLIGVLAFVMKLVFTLAALVAVGLCAFLTFVVFRKLFGKKRASAETATTATTDSITLKSGNGSIRLFQKEPGVQELLQSEGSMLPAPLTLTLNENVEAAILEVGELAAKVKIKAGTYKGKVGWVDKSDIVGGLPK